MSGMEPVVAGATEISVARRFMAIICTMDHCFTNSTTWNLSSVCAQNATADTMTSFAGGTEFDT